MLKEVRIAGAFGSPFEFLFGDEPQRTGRQSGVVFPSEVFLSLEFIPTTFIFGIFEDALDKVAAANQLSQLQW